MAGKRTIAQNTMITLPPETAAPGAPFIERTMHMASPVAGDLLTGVSIQGSADDIEKLTKVRYRTILDHNIRQAIAREKDAKDAIHGASERLRKAQQAIKPPTDYLSDLRDVKKALERFEKKCLLPVFYSETATDDENEEAEGAPDSASAITILFSPTTRKYSVRGAISSSKTRQSLVSCNRDYDFPSSLVQLYDELTAAQEAHQKVQRELVNLRTARSNVDEVAEEAAAAVIQYNFERSKGSELLERVFASLENRAKGAGLEVESRQLRG